MTSGPRAYAVEFVPSALKQLQGLSRQLQERIAPRISSLAENPRPVGVEKIKGETNQYRIRVGDYRIVYAIRDDRLIVLVLRIAHRRDVYRP